MRCLNRITVPCDAAWGIWWLGDVGGTRNNKGGPRLRQGAVWESPILKRGDDGVPVWRRSVAVAVAVAVTVALDDKVVLVVAEDAVGRPVDALELAQALDFLARMVAGDAAGEPGARPLVARNDAAGYKGQVVVDALAWLDHVESQERRCCVWVGRMSDVDRWGVWRGAAERPIQRRSKRRHRREALHGVSAGWGTDVDKCRTMSTTVVALLLFVVVVILGKWGPWASVRHSFEAGLGSSRLLGITLTLVSPFP